MILKDKFELKVSAKDSRIVSLEKQIKDAKENYIEKFLNFLMIF